MLLVEPGDEAVLAEEVQVVGFGDPLEVGQLSLDLRVPVVVVVQGARVQVPAQQRAGGGQDTAPLIGLDGEEVAGLFVTVEGYHFIGFQHFIKSTCLPLIFRK